MPFKNIETLESSDLRPSYVARPNERFASTFLSIENRDFAVKGETLMDKATGEIYNKRTADERVVSFYQNKKYMYELMLKLKILLNNNPNFYFDETAELGFYVNRDYDVMSIMNESVFDLRGTDRRASMTFRTDNGIPGRRSLIFTTSSKSNGFFVRITSRDTDKSVIEWANTNFNYYLKNYSGSNAQAAAYKARLLDETDPFRWSDATINYNLIGWKNGVNTTTNITSYVHINEESLIQIPDEFIEAEYDKIEIDFLAIHFEKIRYILDQVENDDTSIFPASLKNELNELAYSDNHIYLHYINIGTFVDGISQITLLGNEFIIALMDNVYVEDYLNKVSRLAINPAMIRSVTRPSRTKWTNQNLWAEDVRDVLIDTESGTDGQTIIYNECEVDIDGLELALSTNNITTPRANLLSTGQVVEDDDLLLARSDTNPYTRRETDQVFNNFRNAIENDIDNLISLNSSTTSEEGIWVEKVSEESGE